MVGVPLAGTLGATVFIIAVPLAGNTVQIRRKSERIAEKKPF
jgi:hypothetical protein